MFYHFKGSITGEDYLTLLRRPTLISQIGMSVILLIIGSVNFFVTKQLMSLVLMLLFIVAANFYLQWSMKRRYTKNFQAQPMDQYVTKEQIEAQMQLSRVQVLPERVYLFQGGLRGRQVAIFKKEQLEDVTQWESFVTMVEALPIKKGK